MSVPATAYRPLNHDKNEIRLLRLEQGTLTDQPRLTLHVASLAQPSGFCALSYVWGPDEQHKPIQLNDHIINVRPNLEQALRYLQCIKDLAYIWIDVLCINQDDASEKGQQIGLMPEIYSGARKTYMWLGPPVYYSDVAMALLREITTIPESTWNNATTFALCQLTERPYWTRIWVVQEAFYSAHAVLKCGHDEANFDSIYILAEAMTRRNRRPRTDKCPSDPTSNMIRFAKAFPFSLLLRLCPRDREKGTPIRVDLFRLLNFATAFGATLPRDHIFALLNLSFAIDNIFIKPDYAANTTDRRIFAQSAAYLARSRAPQRNLLPLQLRQVGKVLDLPSWVPDFTISAHDARVVPTPHDKEYSAGQSEDVWSRLVPDRAPLGYDTRDRPVQFTFSADFETMIIRGLRIDIITDAVSVADGDNLARQQNFRKKRRTVLQQEILAAYTTWEAAAYANPENAYGSKEKLSEALWRTMMADQCGGEGLPNPPGALYGKSFETWKSLVGTGSGAHIENPSYSDATIVDLDYRIKTFGELRAYACTKNGYVAAVHPSAKTGDILFVFEDGRIPFLLRKREEDGGWSWLGEAYVHGVMYGEALQNATPEDVMVLEVR